MSRTSLLPITLLALCCVRLVAAQGSQPRAVVSADAQWHFTQGDPAGAETPDYNTSTWRTVSVPHDWSIESAPQKTNPTGASGGFAPAGIGWYRKQFTAPANWKGRRVLLEFDGVAANSTVYLNGRKLGDHPYAYTSFHYDLTPTLQFGTQNTIAVRVDNSKQLASRWYVGAGIYRHVRVIVTKPIHVEPQGVFVSTTHADSRSAELLVQTEVRNDSSTGADSRVRTVLRYGDKLVAQQESSITPVAGQNQTTSQTLSVPNPHLWQPSSPSLYAVTTQILQGGEVVDEVTTSTGIRTIAVSADKGLLLNGTAIKLLGGSVHHDNGPLGAAAFDHAEERKAELLKAAGFNLVRTAHNPPSPAFLDACDRLGLLVVEDAFDVWTIRKRTFDYAIHFSEWWQRDVDSMVTRDRNHPSILFWAIGNEIPDAWTVAGVSTAQQLVDRFRQLDPSRPLTQAFPGTTSSPSVDKIMSLLQVAGYNYNLAQNQTKDHERVPGRVMMTTESFPADAFEQWKLTQDHPYILGDIEWTAMDYLGESGIGAWSYGTDKQLKQMGQMASFLRGYMASFGADGKNPMEPYLNGQPDSAMSPGWPWHGSYCGDLDLTGFRKPISYYRDILWNGGDHVHVTVLLPETEDKRLIAPAWAVIPSVDSWTWPGQEGKTMTVETYAKADTVQLLLNGKVIGERPSGAEQQFRAAFTVPYQPGELLVRARRSGKVVAESSLRTAGEATALRLSIDRRELAANGQDVAFINIEAVDAQGRLQPSATSKVHVQVDGVGTLAAVGSGDTQDDSSNAGTDFALFQGRAQAVVRSGLAAGTIHVVVSAEHLREARGALPVRAVSEELLR